VNVFVQESDQFSFLPLIHEFTKPNPDGFVRSPQTPFRSWFDTSPRTEHLLTGHTVRSP
jgi:hypothetical protein